MGFESFLLHCTEEDVTLVVLLNSNPPNATAQNSLVSRLAWALLQD